MDILKISIIKKLLLLIPALILALQGGKLGSMKFGAGDSYTLRYYECFQAHKGITGDEFYLSTKDANPGMYDLARIVDDTEKIAQNQNCEGTMIEQKTTIIASSNEEAIVQARKESPINDYGKLYNNSVKLTDLHEIKDLTPSEAASVVFSNQHPILAWLVPSAFGAVPVDDFESYSAGALNGGAGGTGWSGNWTCSNAEFVVSIVSPSTGVNSVLATLDGNNCYRDFTAIATDNTVFEISIRSDSVVARTVTCYYNGAVSDCFTYLQLGANSNIRYLDDVTLTNIQAASANTWYVVDIKIKPSTEQQAFQVDGGGYGSFGNAGNSTFYDHTAGVSRIKFLSNDIHAQKWDDIGPAAASAASEPINEGTDFFKAL